MKCHLWLQLIADGLVIIEIAASRQAFVENSAGICRAVARSAYTSGLTRPLLCCPLQRGSLRSPLRSGRRLVVEPRRLELPFTLFGKPLKSLNVLNNQ
jgi:hypothetical protein